MVCVEQMVNQLLQSPFDERFGFAALCSEHVHSGCNCHAEEAQALGSGVSAKRKAEFALGRAAARRSLRRFGIHDAPALPIGPGREPLWPAGIVGSITHCRNWAVAVTARSCDAALIGIDLEAVLPGVEEIADVVCHPSEKRWAEADDYSGRLTMIFSAKETVYKALYPLCRRFIGFTEVQLSWRRDEQGFRAELLSDMRPVIKRGFEFDVGCRRHEDWVFSYLAVSSLPERRSHE